MTPLRFDHNMVSLAAQRGQVMVENGERRSLVTLVAWRPHRHGSRTKIARVQYPSGRYASVPIGKVTIPDEGEPCKQRN